MAIFGTKTKKSTAKKEVTTPKTSVPAVVDQSSNTSSYTQAIIRPRVTEKSGMLSQSNVYTFEIAANANKNSVSSAIVSLYKVTPVKVAIINTPNKNVFIRGRKGVVRGVRKALVTLKKGDKIDFI